MKNLKIYLAVLFFSFLAGSNLALIAQTSPKLKSTLSVGESLSMGDLYGNGLTSDNGKYRFLSNSKFLSIVNLQSHKSIDVFEITEADRAITEIRVTEGTVTLTKVALKDPVLFPNEPENKETFVIWGDQSKGSKYTKLVMEDNGLLVLYSGTPQGENGNVLWQSKLSPQ